MAKNPGQLGKAAASALALIMAFEGCTHLPVIPVPGDPPTVCRGHAGAQDRYYSPAECDEITKADLRKVQGQIDIPNLPPEVLGSLIDACYNMGPARCKTTSFYRDFKAGKLADGCNQYPRYIYAHGKAYNGLIRRREAERELCLKGTR